MGRRRQMLGATAVVVGGGAGVVILALAREDFPIAAPLIPGNVRLELAVWLLAAWAYIGSGLAVWTRRPEKRIGPLLVLVGLAQIFDLFRVVDQPVLSTFGEWVSPLYLAVLVYVLLAFPSGRLGSALARSVVVASFANLALLYHMRLLVDDPDVARALSKASFAIGAVLFFAAAAVLLGRLLGGSKAWRRAAALVLWPGAISVGTYGYLEASLFFSDSVYAGPVAIWALRITTALIPFAFLAVLLRGRLSRASVADLVVELEKAMASGALRDALAKALGDPSLAVAYWLPDDGRYVDLDGRPVELPHGRDRRAATLVERDGTRVAAIIHDETLTDDPELLRAVAAAAALALNNERLQAELRAQLEELNASRARILEVAADERKRIERNLHDGAQQRLTSVTLALGLAASKLASDPGAARAGLDQARLALTAALSELRDLSQGIHPSVLTDGGLGPALEDLAYAAPIPVKIAAKPDGRLPEQVEEGAYYVVAEALTNVAKHACASSARVDVEHRRDRLLVSVSDDGVGGADPSDGSGLCGLADRVNALGGTFDVDSRPGSGTEVRAEIPCA